MIATTFGNDAAVEHARKGVPADYPGGATLARVTWSQQADRHWFGGRIPGAPRTVEVVKSSTGDDGKMAYAYESFDASSGKRSTSVAASEVTSRIRAIAGLRPSP